MAKQSIFSKLTDNTDALSGILLLLFAVMAFLANNTANLQPLYDTFRSVPMLFKVGAFEIDKPFLLWINDGWMAVFFLLVGLEIKREFLIGRLQSAERVKLPLIGALGGIVAPIAVYFFITKGTPYTNGWAIPMATDIAFALGILSLFGKRVPPSLKLFLLALAIIDDIAAILVIAFFHTHYLSWDAFLVALVATLLLLVLNRSKVAIHTPYVLVGFLLWASLLRSGFHATLAGVIMAMFIPLEAKGRNMLVEMEHDLHPLVAFVILPLFAFANAGVLLKGLTIDALLHPLPLGIGLGLTLGKLLGVFGFVYVYQKLSRTPHALPNAQVVGVACLCGVGFTMSLFIAGLSFRDDTLLNLCRLGILLGSFISAVAGTIVLHRTLPQTPAA